MILSGREFFKMILALKPQFLISYSTHGIEQSQQQCPGCELQSSGYSPCTPPPHAWQKICPSPLFFRRHPWCMPLCLRKTVWCLHICRIPCYLSVRRRPRLICRLASSEGHVKWRVVSVFGQGGGGPAVFASASKAASRREDFNWQSGRVMPFRLRFKNQSNGRIPFL